MVQIVNSLPIMPLFIHCPKIGSFLIPFRQRLNLHFRYFTQAAAAFHRLKYARFFGFVNQYRISQARCDVVGARLQ